MLWPVVPIFKGNILMAKISIDSRYLLTKLLRDKLGNDYFYLWIPLLIKVKNTEKFHQFNDIDIDRLDKLAQLFYENPKLWWVVLHFNQIEDPFDELDFSDAEDQITYPNYFKEGQDAKIVYPASFNTKNIINLGLDTTDFKLEDFYFLLKGIKIPEFDANSTLQFPSRDNVTTVINNAQTKSTIVS
jgi:hypothetical protein